MNWYRFKIWRHNPFHVEYIDGKYALSQDVALAFFLDRAGSLAGWFYRAEKCLNDRECIDANELNKRRTEEIEFVEWMSQPAYQGAQR